MKTKEILFVLLNEYADWEASSIAAALNEEPEYGDRKYNVKTVSLSKDPIRSIGGFTILPDYAVNEVPDDFGGLILIGGNSWRIDASQVIMPLVEKALNRNLLVAGICDGSVFLGMNGVLNNVKHTSNELNDLQQASGIHYSGSANFLQKQAVRDNNIVTANGSAYLEFGKMILEFLDAASQSEIEEWYDFFKLGYYEAQKKNK